MNNKTNPIFETKYKTCDDSHGWKSDENITSWIESSIIPYELISSTNCVIDPETFYPDFSASLTPDQRPTIFQYLSNNTSTVFLCRTQNCSEISTLSMPGLYSAKFALSGVSARRIQQYSPQINGAQSYFSKGYRAPNRDSELAICLPSDPLCDKPCIQNTVYSPGFGQGGLRLTFTQ